MDISRTPLCGISVPTKNETYDGSSGKNGPPEY